MACEPFDCAECGERHDRCVGHVKNGPRKGLSCRKYPEDGAPACLVHGGGAKQNRKKAKERREEKAAEEVLRKIGGVESVPVTNPYTALSRIAGDAQALVDALGPVFADKDGMMAALLSEDTRPMFLAYERALDRAERFVNNMGKLDLTAKQLQLDQAIADTVIEWLRKVLADPRLGLPVERQQIGLGVVHELVRAQEAN